MSFRYFLLIFCSLFILSFYIWQQISSVRLGYKVNKLQGECERLEEENKNWRLSVNRLISLERLDKIAKKNNLHSPVEKRIVYITQ